MAEQMDRQRVGGPAGSGRRAPSLPLQLAAPLKQRPRLFAAHGEPLLLLWLLLLLVCGDLLGPTTGGNRRGGGSGGGGRRNHRDRLEAALCLRSGSRFVVAAATTESAPQFANTHIRQAQFEGHNNEINALQRQQQRVAVGPPRQSVNATSERRAPITRRVRTAAAGGAQQEVEDWRGTTTTMMTNDVLCNSRCKCLQLEFAQRPGQANESLEEEDKRVLALNQIALIEFSQDYSFDEDADGATAGHTQLAASLEEAEQLDGSGDRQANTSFPARRLTSDSSEALEATGSGASVPLVWLPQAPQSPSKLDLRELATGSGDRATIKLASDQSSGGPSRNKAAMIDQQSLTHRRSGAAAAGASQLRNLRRGNSNATAPLAPPTPLNGHALLLPPFKQRQFAQQQVESLDDKQQQRADLLPAELKQEIDHPTLKLIKLTPLKELDLAAKKLGADFDADQAEVGAQQAPSSNSSSMSSVKLLVEALREIDSNRSEFNSLSLRNNNLKFEMWTQIYSLLLIQMRTQLYKLDLSHNALVKLGVTFTGYIEHHFVYQLMRSNGSDTSWPFAAQARPSVQTSAYAAAAEQANGLTSSSGKLNSTTTTSVSSYLKLLEPFKLTGGGGGGSASLRATPPLVSASGAAVQQQAAASGVGSRTSLNMNMNMKRLFRRPILGDGRLYSVVRLEMPLALSSGGGGGISSLNNSSNVVGSQNGTNSIAVAPLEQLEFAHLRHLSTNLLATNTNFTSNLSGSWQQLVQLLLHQPARVRALDLSHNKLKWLINDQFRILKHVQSIRLDHNRIRFIHQQAFNGLVELKYLNLNYNRLQTIYMEQFQTNYKLLALFMKANYLSYLRAGALASQTNLKRLELSRNKLTILSSNAFIGLENLEWLNLSSNSFVHVPSAAFHPLMMSLKLLDLSDNQLAQLTPGAFFHFNQLEQLHLADNDQLVSIERGSFWDLPHLIEVSLRSSSQLMAINQQAFVGVPQLKTILVDECPLLDLQTRHMLENITTTNTMRSLLKQQQQQQPISQNNQNATSATNNSTINAPRNNQTTSIASGNSSDNLSIKSPLSPKDLAKQLNATTNSTIINEIEQPTSQQQQQLLAVADERRLELLGGPSNMLANYQQQYQQQMSIQLAYDQTSATNKITKYFYSLGALILLVGALKLVFHYTSTRHYLNLRRRRRRVYQAAASSTATAIGGDTGNRPSSETIKSDDDDDDDDDDDGDGEQLDLDEMVAPSILSRTSQSIDQSSRTTTNENEINEGHQNQIGEDLNEELDESTSSSLNRSSINDLSRSYNSLSLANQQEQQPKNVLDCSPQVQDAAGSQPDLLVDNAGQSQMMIGVDLSCPDCLSQRQAMEEMRYGEMDGSVNANVAPHQQQLSPNCCDQPTGLCSLDEANCAHCYQSLMDPDLITADFYTQPSMSSK